MEHTYWKQIATYVTNQYPLFGLDMCILTKYNHHLTHTANTFFNFPQDPTRKRVSTSAIAKRKSQTEYRIENAIFSSSVHSLIV